MRNKWYVLGIGAAAVLVGLLALRAVLNDAGPFLILPPLAVALGLAFAAYKVSKAQSFAPDKGRDPREYNVSTHVPRGQRNQPPNTPPGA